MAAGGRSTALARGIKVFGAAHPHHAYLFANKRANRIKVLVHDGIGIWLAARRLNQGRFVWSPHGQGHQVALTHEQLQALVIGLPWQRSPTVEPERAATACAQCPVDGSAHAEASTRNKPKRTKTNA